MDEVINKKLLIISRARYRIVDGKIYFQNLDGPYLDEIAKNFKHTSILAEYYNHVESLNLTYNFQNSVQVWDLKKKSNIFIRIKRLFLFIKKNDVIFVFMPLLTSALGIIISKLLGRIVVYYSGNPWDEAIKFNKNNYLVKFLPGFIFRLFDAIIIRMSDVKLLNNNQMFEKYKNLNNIEKTKPITFLGKENFNYLYKPELKNPINLISVGHVVNRKGYEFLIEGLGQLYQSNKLKKEITLHIVGKYFEDNYLNKLKKIIKKYSLTNRIIFHGLIQDKELLLNLYRSSDVFIITSLSEGFPRVIWEAMSQSLPSIVTSLSNIKEELKYYPNCVYFIKPQNSFEVMNSIIELTTNNILRIKLIQNSHNYLTKIFNEKPSEQVLRLVHHLLN